MSDVGLLSVDKLYTALKSLLDRAREIKPNGGIEPTLTSASFSGDVEKITREAEGGFAANAQENYAALETACRSIFYDILASTSIEDPSFSQTWNLLDIISILSDIPLCEPGLVFWLVEELLDSQTIDGCRVVFDYLDSRRERLTAKHFKQKQLIILRACNELLRRLSRAEDTVFCGRVFIFMFQSFPLGDRSSVNLRGEYHVENVTVFERPSPKELAIPEDSMDIDRPLPEVPDVEEIVLEKAPPEPSKVERQDELLQGNDSSLKTVKFKSLAEAPQDIEPDTDMLYPLFWSLQEDFSQPTRLFDPQILRTFQSGLDITLRKFKAIQQEQQSRGPSKVSTDPNRPSGRNSAGSGTDRQELANSFNPRYLTSRDLFELELSDLAFRRYILVQSLILVDFLLSLSPKAKRKLEHTSNKSVLYNHSLSEEEIKWGINVRAEIASYLQQGPEGKFYYRMVDTVLSRDKNWVHWKAESCPPIELPPVSAESFLKSEQSAKRVCTSKRLRPTPMGSLDLHFLSQTGENAGEGFDELKHPDRYSVPKAEDFKGPILDDELDIDMAKTDKAKEVAIVAKASKVWRTLRIASKNRLTLFDKIEDGGDLAPLFESPKGEQYEKGQMDDLDAERVGDDSKVEEIHLDDMETSIGAQPAAVEAT